MANQKTVFTREPTVAVVILTETDRGILITGAHEAVLTNNAAILIILTNQKTVLI